MHSKITVFDITVPTYGVIVLLGVSVVIVLGIFVSLREKLSISKFLQMGLFGGCSAIVGAKLWHALASTQKGNNIVTTLLETKNGYSFYGGLTFGLLSILLFSKIRNIRIEEYTQKLIFLVPLLHGIWKIGCFMAGCCYGTPYEGVGAVVFPEGAGAPPGISLFPIQLFESFVSFAMAIVFYVKRQEKRSNPIRAYICEYSFVRFFIEFLRFRTEQGNLSMAQKISLCCFTAVIIYEFISTKTHRNKRGIL